MSRSNEYDFCIDYDERFDPGRAHGHSDGKVVHAAHIGTLNAIMETPVV